MAVPVVGIRFQEYAYTMRRRYEGYNYYGDYDWRMVQNPLTAGQMIEIIAAIFLQLVCLAQGERFKEAPKY